MGIDSNLIIKNVALLRDEVESFKKYPFNIDVVKNFKELKFNSQVTFFIGENGTGKSTLIEAIAVALGMPAEGGTNNFMYETKNTTSELSEYLRIGNDGGSYTVIYESPFTADYAGPFFAADICKNRN